MSKDLPESVIAARVASSRDPLEIPTSELFTEFRLGAESTRAREAIETLLESRGVRVSPSLTGESLGPIVVLSRIPTPRVSLSRPLRTRLAIVVAALGVLTFALTSSGGGSASGESEDEARAFLEDLTGRLAARDSTACIHFEESANCERFIRALSTALRSPDLERIRVKGGRAEAEVRSSDGGALLFRLGQAPNDEWLVEEVRRPGSNRSVFVEREAALRDDQRAARLSSSSAGAAPPSSSGR